MITGFGSPGRIFSRLNKTRPLQNAKVMAREKQCEAAKKVMLMVMNPLKNSFFENNLAIVVALVLFSFI